MKITVIESDQFEDTDELDVAEDFLNGKRVIVVGLKSLVQTVGVDEAAAKQFARAHVVLSEAQAGEVLTRLSTIFERNAKDEVVQRLTKRNDEGLRSLHYLKNELYDLKTSISERAGEALFELFGIDALFTSAIAHAEQAGDELRGTKKEPTPEPYKNLKESTAKLQDAFAKLKEKR